MGKVRGTMFVGTPESAVFTHHPALGPGSLYPYDGLGVNIDRQDFSVAPNDPWLAKLRERHGLKVMTELVLGEVGWGKSSQIKSTLMDLSSTMLGDYELVIDLHDKKLEHDIEVEDSEDPGAEPGPLKKFERVGEWFPTGEWLDNKQIPVREISSNCFDPVLIKRGYQALDIAQEVAYFGNLGIPIPPQWLFHYQVAMFIMMRDYPMPDPFLFERLLIDQSLQDARDFYKDAFQAPIMGFDEYFGDTVLDALDPEEREHRLGVRDRIMPERMDRFASITEEEIKATAWQASLPFNQLIRGSDGALLGQHSLATIVSEGSSCATIRRLGNTYDWTGMTRRAISFQKALLAKFRVIDRETPGGGILSPDIEVEDEDHSNWQDLIHARWKTEERKLGRQSNTYSIQLAHRLSDYLAVGNEGSEQRRLARNFLEEVTMRRLFHQRGSEENRGHLENIWGLEPEIVEYATRQRVGESVVIIGEMPAHRYSLPLSEIERVITFTESALGRGLNRRREFWGAIREYEEAA